MIGPHQLRAAARLQLRNQAVTPWAVLAGALAPAILTLLVAAQFGGTPPSLFVGAMLSAMVARLPDLAVVAVMQDRKWAVLPQLLTSPTRLGWIVAGRALGAGLEAMVGLPIVLGLLWLVGGPPSGTYAVMIIAMALGVLNLVVLTASMMAFVVPRRYRAGMMNAVFPVAVLMFGLYVPVEDLSSWVAVVSRFFGISWAVTAVRVAENGGSALWPLLLSALTTAGLALGVAFQLARLDSATRARSDVVLT